MKLSSGEKKMFFFSGFIIVIALGGGLFYNGINATSDITIAPYPTAPAPNGFDLYVAAAGAIVPANPPVSAAIDRQTASDPKVRAQRYSLARKMTWLKQNQKAFALFDQAQKTPSLAPPNRNSFAPMNTQLVTLRYLARDKMVESNALWMSGDAADSLDSALDVVQMGHDARRGGEILTTLVGISIGSIGRVGAHQTVDRLDASQARRNARRLEKMSETRWGLADTLTEQKAVAQSAWRQIFQMKGWRVIIPIYADDPTAKTRLEAGMISKKRILSENEALFNAYIARARSPYARRNVPPVVPANPFLKSGATGVERQFFLQARDLVGDQVLMLQLALRAYRLENGAYPAQLNALCPRYLNAIPADPFGAGEPMHYKRSGPTYRLWSIGPDGIDDGGTPAPWEKKRSTLNDERPRLPYIAPESKGDYVAGKNA